jgi:phosphoribosylglycinamide formyltransferase-1
VKRIAVFVSGGGSNLQALINEIAKGEIKGEIAAVISSKQSAYALKRAQRAGLPAFVFEKKDYENTDAMFSEIASLLKKLKIDLIVLAGYMLVLSPLIIKEFKNRIINIHPSLIPSFCGKGYYGLKVHEAVLQYGCKVTGATVHFVDEGTDTGPIILQKAVNVKQGDTPEILQKRVLKYEHRLLPLSVKLYCEDKIILNGRITEIKK